MLSYLSARLAMELEILYNPSTIKLLGALGLAGLVILHQIRRTQKPALPSYIPGPEPASWLVGTDTVLLPSPFTDPASLVRKPGRIGPLRGGNSES